MSKPVTAERIRKALARIKTARGRDERFNRDSDIIQSLATYGFQSAASRAFGVKEDPLTGQRVSLDMTYLEGPRSPENMHFLLARWRRSINRYSSKIDRIHDIQAQNNISGLSPCTTEFGFEVVKHLGVDDDLVLIESDLDKLNEQKPKLVEKWADYAILNGLDFYKRTDGSWEPSNLDAVYAVMPFYQWAHSWEHISYTSPSQMNLQGWDNLRSQPKYEDDQKYWEVHLSLGNGLDVDACGMSIWFCASDRVPSN